jgi:hypothetical protein
VRSLPSELSVEVLDVWDGSSLGQVVISVISPERRIETACVPPIPMIKGLELGRSKEAEPTCPQSVKLAHKTFEDCMAQTGTSRSLARPAGIEKAIQNSPRKPFVSLRSESDPIKSSIESFVSFLSRSPEVQDDFVLTEDETGPLEDVSEAMSRIEEEAKAHVQSELSAAGNAREMLMRKIAELDAITSRLEGRSPEANLSLTPREDPQPISIVPTSRSSADKSKPTHAFIRRKQRRRLISRHRLRGISKSPSIEEVSTGCHTIFTTEDLPLHSSEVEENSFIVIPGPDLPPHMDGRPLLSVVTTRAIALLPSESTCSQRTLVLQPFQPPAQSLSSKRKESIEKARKTISSLRKSFLKDADRICGSISARTSPELSSA